MSDAQAVPGDAAGIARAAELLRAGRLVAVPTETVYGLAARADSDAAVAAIYRAKGRPDFNPLIVHVADLAMAERIAVFGARARALAARFWPVPLTWLLPARDAAPIVPAVRAGLGTVAVRVPAHPAMRALLAETALPLAAPSANRSGAVSPTAAAHVVASLGEIRVCTRAELLCEFVRRDVHGPLGAEEVDANATLDFLLQGVVGEHQSVRLENGRFRAREASRRALRDERRNESGG